MAESTFKIPERGSAPPALAGIGRLWGRISPSLVPVLAVITALLITVPFMILTGGKGDVGRGLRIAGSAYSALLEGSLGLTINDQISADDLRQITALANSASLQAGDLRTLVRAVNDTVTAGIDNAQLYADLFAAFPGVERDVLGELGGDITAMRALGEAQIDGIQPLVAELSEDRTAARDLAEQVHAAGSITPEMQTAIAALAPSAATMSAEELYNAMVLVDTYNLSPLGRFAERLDLVRQHNLTLDAPVLTTLETLSVENAAVDVSAAERVAGIIEQLRSAGITDVAELSSEIATVRALYDDVLLTNADVSTALAEELPVAEQNNLIVRRPGDRLVIDHQNQLSGSILGNNNTPDDTSDDRTDVVYLRLGGSALLFFPSNLETMLIRAVPFIIAGLAVTLGFKAGLFNIGAEGQLYAGAIVAVWVGFSPLFAAIPAIIHIPLVIVAGIFGGAFWGAIPGALKAFTGAHEVIVTIMLNYIAVLIVDWLIKSTNPVLLLDTTASTPRTPFVLESAQLPRFISVPSWLFIVVGVLLTASWLYGARSAIQRDIRAAIRPIVYGVLIVVGGYFLQWISVRGALHIGFVIMLITVWFVDWFLTKTTLGFELRTVGANPDAARYSGMSVPRNIILAMALSGALAGLAGTIEVSGVQLNMQPNFFSGLGFDAIAVALLARNNVRSMIAAGILWGSLLTGAGLMQLRADISIDLVKVIQALIIMFIAADAIIRYLWAIPKTSDKTAVSMFSKGWGG